MEKPQSFDFDEPSRDALAGIYVEVNDSMASPSADLSAIETCQVERLFGLTLTVEDESASKRKNERV